MQTPELLARTRDGQPLSDAQIRFLIDGYTRGLIPDYQIAAWLMAVTLRGLTPQETSALTAAMAESGHRIDPVDLPTPSLDKHSTGGVGDKVSLVVVPLLAAAGVFVCKMSGRGLGHTGGTLDKLEAIPGFRVQLTPEEMRAQVRTIGACLAGQTGDLAPADRKLYALRDVTATVGSLPLIVSSILSKKLAGGASSLLFDVKVGGGALMKTEPEARALAQALVDGAAGHGRRALALLSDMSQPLGRTIGNALEVAEAIEALSPESAAVADPRLRTLCVTLAAHGVALATGRELATAHAQIEDLLRSGAAWERFRRIVAAQGGDPEIVDDPGRLPQAPLHHPVTTSEAGWVAAIDARRLGEIVVALGGGRLTQESVIDPAVGLVLHAAVGQRCAPGALLAEIHARDLFTAQRWEVAVRDAFSLQETPAEAPWLIHGLVGHL